MAKHATATSAINAAIRKYTRLVRWAVRRRMPQAMRARFDSEDFVQMVWGSYFRKVRMAPEETAVPLDDRELKRLLMGMVRNKVAGEMRRARSREVTGLDGIPTGPQRDDPLPPSVSGQLIDSVTPSRHAMARERLARLLSRVSLKKRQVIQMRMLGASFAEIAGELGISESTAREIVMRIVGEEE